MKRLALLISIGLILAGWSLASWAQISISGLNGINIPADAFIFNPASGKLEGSGSDQFQVIIDEPDVLDCEVSITSVICPITKAMATGSAVGYLSAFLSRNDLMLPSPSITDVVLVVWIKVPLIVLSGVYTGGAVQITVTAIF